MQLVLKITSSILSTNMLINMYLKMPQGLATCNFVLQLAVTGLANPGHPMLVLVHYSLTPGQAPPTPLDSAKLDTKTWIPSDLEWKCVISNIVVIKRCLRLLRCKWSLVSDYSEHPMESRPLFIYLLCTNIQIKICLKIPQAFATCKYGFSEPESPDASTCPSFLDLCGQVPCRDDGRRRAAGSWNLPTPER